MLWANFTVCKSHFQILPLILMHGRLATQISSTKSNDLLNFWFDLQRLMRRMWTWMPHSMCMLELLTPGGPPTAYQPRGTATRNLLAPVMSSWSCTMASSQTMRFAYSFLMILFTGIFPSSIQIFFCISILFDFDPSYPYSCRCTCIVHYCH